MFDEADAAAIEWLATRIHEKAKELRLRYQRGYSETDGLRTQHDRLCVALAHLREFLDEH